MAKTAGHSEIPWKKIGDSIYTDSGQFVFSIYGNHSTPLTKQQANAEFIVRAVNNHDKLVEALKGLTVAIDTKLTERQWVNVAREFYTGMMAIKEAEGE